MSKLEELRNEVDAADDAILAALMRRCARMSRRKKTGSGSSGVRSPTSLPQTSSLLKSARFASRLPIVRNESLCATFLA